MGSSALTASLNPASPTRYDYFHYFRSRHLYFVVYFDDEPPENTLESFRHLADGEEVVIGFHLQAG